jgi:hypothetical protein
VSLVAAEHGQFPAPLRRDPNVSVDASKRVRTLCLSRFSSTSAAHSSSSGDPCPVRALAQTKN